MEATDLRALGDEINAAYERLRFCEETKMAFAKRAATDYGKLVVSATEALNSDPGMLLTHWSQTSLESYFELAVILLLTAASEAEQTEVFNDLVAQLQSLLAHYPRSEAIAGVRALLESLMIAIEDFRPKTSHLVLELLAQLLNAPEGIISPTRPGSPQNRHSGAHKGLLAEDKILLSQLLQVGLYREVKTFLEERNSLKAARLSGGFLENILTPIVTFSSRKGGVGKSMLVFATAVWFLSKVKPGANVCIIDLDLSGPVWQYLLFPETNRPSHFLNDLLSIESGNQKGQFEFPELTTDKITALVTRSSVEVEGTQLSLLSLADRPRSNRYLSVALANNSEACFKFLVQLLDALQSSADLVIIDNGPGLGTLPLLSHVLTTSIPHGCSVFISTPALPDLRGSILELSDLYVLDRDSPLTKRKPIWIVNKADEEALAFISGKHTLLDVAAKIESCDQIPDRPLIARAVSSTSAMFGGLGLPLDPALLAFGNIKNSDALPLRSALKSFGNTTLFSEFVRQVGPMLEPLLTKTTKTATYSK